MEDLFNTVERILEGINSAAKLKDFYDSSEPLKHAVEITALLHRISQITNQQELEHLKVDLKIHVNTYKEEFEKLGINICDYLNFEIKQ